MSWQIESYGNGCFTLSHFVLDEIFTCFQYKINIFLTKEHESANDWIQFHINSQKNVRLIGFDTEAQCGHRKGEKPRTCLIQLCVENHYNNSEKGWFVLLYHCPRNNRLPKNLVKVIESDKYLKCGIGIIGLGGDARDLLTHFGVNMRGAIDLFDVTKEGLKKSMSQICRGMEVPSYKSICTSNWGNKSLDKRQIMYSSLDAFYGICLAQHYEKKGEVFEPTEDARTMVERLEAEKKARETAKRRMARIKKKLKRDKFAVLLELLRKDNETDKQVNSIAKLILLYTPVEEEELKNARETRI